jgi:hypothetical protein
MAKVQTRRCVSLKREVYDKIRTYCKRNQVSISSVVEEALNIHVKVIIEPVRETKKSKKIVEVDDLKEDDLKEDDLKEDPEDEELEPEDEELEPEDEELEELKDEQDEQDEKPAPTPAPVPTPAPTLEPKKSTTTHVSPPPTKRSPGNILSF